MNYLLIPLLSGAKARVSHADGVVCRVEVASECIAGDLSAADFRLIRDRVAFIAGPVCEIEDLRDLREREYWAHLDERAAAEAV